MGTETDPTGIGMQILLLAFLTLINAFFASAEMAIVSINKTKMKMLYNQGNKKAGLILKIVEEPTNFLSTIQVGITLAGFFASASAATGLSKEFGQTLNSIGIPYGDSIAFVGVTIILSYFTLVFGELFPKEIALNNSEKIALMSVNIILFISKIAKPFVKILSLSSKGLVKITGIDKDKSDNRVTKEEIQSLVETGEEHGTINETEKEMIEGIFKFDNKKVDKIMIPRTEAYCINYNEDISTYIDEMLRQRYSKIPVYEGEIDNIIGVLYIKDLFIEVRKNGFNNIDIKNIMREAYFVPEVKPVKDLFEEMQLSKKQIAIIIDEYGGFSGIATIEDLIEEIIGEIEDEFDKREESIKILSDNTFLVDGVTTLEEINEKLDLDITSEDVDTINGYLINKLGKIPISEEEKIIEEDNITFKIQEVNDKRIEKVIIVT